MPTEISDWNDLDNVSNDLTGDYVLVNDLDSETDGYAGIGDDFEPIGRRSFDANAFGGTFDGDGFNIQNIEINTDGADRGCGLFGGVEGTDPSLMNISVSGVYSGVFSEDFAGGLVGSFEDGIIQNCVSHVDVTSDGEQVGGLVGQNDDTITESYATGSVEGDSNVGGLVGQNFETVTDSYATGSVEGDGQVGGLVGRNDDSVTESYATGSVEGDSNVGGLVGFNGDTVTDSYWDTETTGQSTSDGGTGLTTDEMTGDDAETNMDGLDFFSEWDLVEADLIFSFDGEITLNETAAETATVILHNLDKPEDIDFIAEDGYPILSNIDESNQLEDQGVLDTQGNIARTETDSDGNYEANILADNGDTIAVAADFDDGLERYGRLITTVIE